MSKASSKKFFKEYLSEKKVVGAVAPSSRFLCNKMLAGIDFDQDLVIVEYGPGTGVFTDEIIKRMNSNSVLYVFELNEVFYDALAARIKDPRVKIFHDSASKAEEFLNLDNYHHADVVLSSLPLAVIPQPIKKEVMRVSEKLLADQGIYVQFQYSLNAKKLLKKHFRNMKISFTAINLPPAFVYQCSNR
ncbi:MAG: ribosomal RNA adenine dimethylase [Crocinitomicaceae bacterium]|nr:ribosomal RNA adenine dimethylase [Crocinitomicaceae bacterium]